MFRQWRVKKKTRDAPSCNQESGCDFPIHAAIRRTDEVVSQSASVACMKDQADQDGNTPLHLAVERGYTKWVDYLLAKKADINIVNKFGMTPFLLAVRHSYPGLVRLLLDHGANPHYVNHTRQTALHYACCGGDEQILTYLLQSKVKVNLQDANGVTPLILACQMQQPAKVEQLMAHKAVAKANPNLCDKLGRSPLHWVAEVGDPACARALIAAKADLNAADADMETPFVRAIKTNNIPVLDVLIEAGCDRTDIDGLSGTAMTMAGLLGRTQVMERLLAAGEDPDEVGHLGFTPLTAAVFESHVDTVKLLLDSGADPSQSSRTGNVPLTKALCYVRSTNIDARHQITKMLLRANADANVRVTTAGHFTAITNGRNCPLSFALTAGCTSMVHMHLIAGCRITTSEVEEWLCCMSPTLQSCFSELFETLLDWAANVRSLKFLCRQVVRRKLGHTVHLKLAQLSLPTVITGYLDFSEMDNIAPEFGNIGQNVSKEYLTVPRTPCGLRSLQGTLSYNVLGAPSYQSYAPTADAN